MTCSVCKTNEPHRDGVCKSCIDAGLDESRALLLAFCDEQERLFETNLQDALDAGLTTDGIQIKMTISGLKRDVVARIPGAQEVEDQDDPSKSGYSVKIGNIILVSEDGKK